MGKPERLVLLQRDEPATGAILQESPGGRRHLEGDTGGAAEQPSLTESFAGRAGEALQRADISTQGRRSGEYIRIGREGDVRKRIFQVPREVTAVAWRREQGQNGVEHLLRTWRNAIGQAQAGDEGRGQVVAAATFGVVDQGEDPAATIVESMLIWLEAMAPGSWACAGAVLEDEKGMVG